MTTQPTRPGKADAHAASRAASRGAGGGIAPGERRLGYAATAAQLGALAVLAVRAGGIPRPLGARVALAGAVALALWALASMGRRTFRVTPDPRPGGALATRGPYRWIRHPMYTSVALAAVAWGVSGDDGVSAAALAVLAGALTVKIHLEERFLARTYPGYDALRAKTRRLIPFLF